MTQDIRHLAKTWTILACVSFWIVQACKLTAAPQRAGIVEIIPGDTTRSLARHHEPSSVGDSHVPTAGNKTKVDHLDHTPTVGSSSPGAGARTGTEAKGGQAARTSKNRATSPARLAVVTAYCDGGPCADGKPAGPGRVAAPRWIHLGTRAYIPGYGACVVADRTAKRFNGRWDVPLDTRAKCIAWGKRIVKVTVRL